MAVTKGHGNPNWTREEVILAPELYHSVGDSLSGPNDERVVRLSSELRSLPYHREASKRESFRNPAGIAFKLQNIRQVAGDGGLSHTAKIDKEVWEEFGKDKKATLAAATRIRGGVKIIQSDEAPEVEFEFSEGRAVTEAHKRIERNKHLRVRLLKSRREKEGISCDVCGCTGAGLDQSIRESLFEAHHIKPLADIGVTKTKLADMSLLCANCHRLVHRLINIRKSSVSLDEAKGELFAYTSNY